MATPPLSDLLSGGTLVRGQGELAAGGSIALEPSDLEALREFGPCGGQHIQTAKIRHHSLARLLATGMSNQECADATGYSLSHISSLTVSPAFKGLVEGYLKRTESGLVGELRERTVALATDFLSRLHAKVLDDDVMGEIPVSKLTDATIKLLDRAGVGPTSRSEHLHAHFGVPADELAGIKREAALAEQAVSVPEGQRAAVSLLAAAADSGTEGKHSSPEEGPAVSEAAGEVSEAEVIKQRVRALTRLDPS